MAYNFCVTNYNVNNVLMESIKWCHRSITVKEIGKTPVMDVRIRNFKIKLTTEEYVYNSRSLNINKYKRKFRKL